MLAVHEPTRSLLLQAPDPFSIRDLIPQSKLLNTPQFNVALKHSVEATRILRNLGYEDVPSPILHFYDWPGKYTPFAHQKVMAEFMTLNPRGFNLSEMGCVDASTEYLSPSGWRRIDQYDGGLVGQYHPASGAVEMVEPLEYVKRPCRQMIRFKTTRGVDQLLSPEHRVLLADGSVVSAQHIFERYGSQSMECRNFRFRTTFSVAGGHACLSDADTRLHVAASADGYWDKSATVVVRVKKPRKIARLRQLLIDAERPFTERPQANGFTVFRFKPVAEKGLHVFWGGSQHQMEVIASELAYWDGSHRKANAIEFYGTKADTDLAQFALSASGRRTTIAHDLRGDNHWRVHARAGDPTIGLYGRNGNEVAQNVALEPSPDGFKYCFMVPSTFLLLRRNGCIFATGNTGKSAAALWGSDFMMKEGVVRRTLVLSPLSTLETVWTQDIFDVLMHRVASVVYGTRKQRLDALAVDASYYIMNHDAVSIDEVAEAVRKRKDIDLIIVDEGSMFRSHKAQKFKDLEKMIRPEVRVWWMTGTPCPNAPTDAWAQCRIVNPKRVPTFYGAFQRSTMMQISPYKWVPRPGMKEQVFEIMQPAIRFKKQDCLDLPPVITIQMQTKLSKEQLDHFKKMKNEMHVEFVADTLRKSMGTGTQITAVNAADKLNKLRQILCGSIKDPNTETYFNLDHKPRLEVLKQAIETASAKVLVVVPFKGIINTLATELEDDYSIGILNGDVSPKRRNEIITAFKTTDDPQVLLCHPKVMAHGINFTEADTTIFYAPIFSNDEYQQVIERFNRAGQTRKMTIIRIGGHPLEWDIYKMIDNKKATQDGILDLYKRTVA